MTSQPSTAQLISTSRISGLVLINAMIFQEILADNDSRIFSLQKMLNESNLLNAFSDHWNFIIEQINYHPIFYLAREILLNLTASSDIIDVLQEIIQTAQNIVTMRAALRHDLMGRIYHRLLVEAKYLGTYYTSIPAATLLLKLALRPTNFSMEWHDLEQVRQLRIADLACGTGTLLMASADSVTDNYISASAIQGEKINLQALQKILVENILLGYDVLPSALHLTASTLALRAPSITFKTMNLFCLPLGGRNHRLGSIEFLRNKIISLTLDLFGTPKINQITGEATKNISEAPLPNLDLCAMNPPFTRSVGGNLLFGSLPNNERKQMQKELKKLVKRYHVKANITAGLGSVFVATIHSSIKPGGRIALVLPKALLSGVAWNPTRGLLQKDYQVEYLVVSQDPERWNFSENTDLSEVLVVAKKNDKEPYEVHEDNGQVVVLNLWHNPPTSFEALSVAHTLIHNEAPDIANGQGALEIHIDHKKLGEAVTIPWNTLKMQPHWLPPCTFAQSDLIRTSYHLLEGNLWLPRQGFVGKLNLCPLNEFGDLGFDRRDLHDGFKLSKTSTPYPAFWGNRTKNCNTLAQSPNRYLSPLSKAKKSRHLRKPEDLWSLAGKIMILESNRLNTNRLVAVRLPQIALSNVWWSFVLKKGKMSDYHEKVLVLWLNSTLGLFLLLANRTETQGAWVHFKKPILEKLPIIDLRTLSSKQLREFASAYDKLCNEPMLPLSEIHIDSVRTKIDKSIAKILKLPDFSILRELLAKEPIVCLKQLY